MKKDIAVALLSVLAVAGLTFALDTAIPEKPMTPSRPFVPDGKGHGSPDDSPVVMSVNGETITEREFNQFVEQVPPEQRPMYQTPQGRQALSEELVRIKMLEQEARKQGLDREPNVQRQLGAIESQILAGEALKKLIPVPSEQEVRAAYEQERPSFKTVELSHVLVAYQGGAVPPRSGQPATIEQATQKANAIAARLRGGADFGRVASTESDDLSNASQGGSLGAVPMNMLPPDMQSAVLNLGAGQISNPIRTAYGIHIFKAGQRQTRSFDELRPALEQRLRQDRLESTMKRLTAGAKVERNEAFFGKPAAPFNPPQAAPQPGKS